MSKQTKPSIVFVQGVWTRRLILSKVIPTLQADGHEVIAARYGLDTLAGDVAAVKSALARVSSPAILVGHSYGGTLITAAGTDPRVAGLVYIVALAPDADETSESQFPVSDVFPTSKWRMDGSGYDLRALSALRETCLNRIKDLSGQPMQHRPRTRSTTASTALPVSRNRVGTSPFNPSWNYDKSSSFFGQYGDKRVTEVARYLDAALEAVLRIAVG